MIATANPLPTPLPRNSGRTLSLLVVVCASSSLVPCDRIHLLPVTSFTHRPLRRRYNTLLPHGGWRGVSGRGEAGLDPPPLPTQDRRKRMKNELLVNRSPGARNGRTRPHLA